MEYFKPGAKDEQRKKVHSQMSVVREKVKKWADKVVVGGFNEKHEIVRKEGDVWEDDGKTWTVKHGVKQTIRKNQSAVTPWWCPKCGKTLTSKLDSKLYTLRGACHDCVVVYEGKMRVDGVWDAYERHHVRRNEIAFLTSKISEIEDYIRTFKEPQLHFSDGRWEKIATKDMFEEQFNEYRKDIAHILLKIASILKEEEADADKYREFEEWESKNSWTSEPNSPVDNS